jgi:hypothetical protein
MELFRKERKVIFFAKKITFLSEEPRPAAGGVLQREKGDFFAKIPFFSLFGFLFFFVAD